MAGIEPVDGTTSSPAVGHTHAASVWSIDAVPFENNAAPASPRPYAIDEWPDDAEVQPDTPLQALSTDAGSVSEELALRPGLSADQVATIRRRFAMRNHPDKLPLELQDSATQRMMVANALCDAYLMNGTLTLRNRTNSGNR
jgi:hypothetical protein